MKQTAQRRAFQLAPLRHWTWLLLVALWVGLMLVAYLGGTNQQSAANPVPWWLVVPFATALLPVGLGVALTHRSIDIEGDRLVIAAALVFARKVPVAELELDKARVLSLDERTELKPMLQLGGFTLPGFNAGHYLLRNRNRAICLLTDRQRVLVLPRRDSRLLLLSPEQPQVLLDALRAIAQP